MKALRAIFSVVKADDAPAPRVIANGALPTLVVRTPDGHVLLDPTGKKSGRGAYLCARRSCWELALKMGRLEHELELTLLEEDRAASK